MATNFSSVPVLDYSLLSDPSTRPQFIAELQNALINVGFFYISNTPVAQEDVDSVIELAPRFFDLPDEEKERIRMIHSPHFFGYSRFGAELTKGKVDQREQFDFGTPYEFRWKEGDPAYRKLWGPSQVSRRASKIFVCSHRTDERILHSGPRKPSYRASAPPTSATSSKSTASATSS